MAGLAKAGGLRRPPAGPVTARPTPLDRPPEAPSGPVEAAPSTPKAPSTAGPNGSAPPAMAAPAPANPPAPDSAPVRGPSEGRAESPSAPRRSPGEAGNDESAGRGEGRSGFGRRRDDEVAKEAAASADSGRAGKGADRGKPDRLAKPAETAGMMAVNQGTIVEAKRTVQPMLMDLMDVGEASKMPRTELAQQINDILGEVLAQQKLQLNMFEQRDLVTLLINDMLGLGPIEPLLHDDSISEVMVNGPDQVYIEREGRLIATDIRFQDNHHVMNVATRIVTAIGRRVDESSPICDARLADGSRVNVIVPPLAIDGPTITIRKFKKDKLTFDDLITFGAMSPGCAKLLQVISTCRCNILISGGTGSGKTTLLNCLTHFIDAGERVITCEDAAELQLQQPHVVRLETRPANLEGAGQVTMRDLVRNCLRMRPERIIVGEVRGPEAFDLLQAMNTGHDGSMGTVHANNPREAITRLENMIAMGGFNMPSKAVREQIAAALHVIVQTQRLRDDSRKITHVTEVLGMEGEVVTMQDLYLFDHTGEDRQGRVIGRHYSTGLHPSFADKARYFGLERELHEALFEDG